MQKKLYGILFLFIFSIVFKGYSLTYYSRVVAGNWATPASWSTSACSGVAAVTTPTLSDNVVICSGHTITMNSNPGSCLSLTISGVATWTSAFTTNVGSGGITINTGGNITGAVNGILTTTGGLIINATLTSTTVTIVTQTTAGQAISGIGSLARLSVNATTTNNGTLTVTTALNGASTLTQGSSSTLNYAGTGVIVPTLVATASGNTVNYSGTGTQTIRSATYYNLIISNAGTSTLGGIITVNNNLSLTGGTLASSTFQITGNSTGLLTLSAGTILTLGTTTSATVVDFPSNYTTGNISLASTSTVTYQGNYAQTVSTDPASYGNLTLVTGAATVTKTLSSAVDIVVARSLTLTNGTGSVTFDVGVQNLTVTGAIGGNGNLTMGGGNLTTAGSFVNTGTFTPGSGLVTYSGASQTIKSAIYQSLTTSGSGTKTLGGAITINGNLSVNAGSLATSTFQITGNPTGTFSMATITTFTIGNTGSATNVLFPTNFTNANIFFTAGSTIIYQGNSAQTISSIPTYRNLTLSTYSGSKAANGTLTVLGNFAINSPTTLSMTSYTLNLTGAFTGNGGLSFTSGNFNITGSNTNSGAFTCGTGTVDYNSTVAQTVKGTTYYNLTISGAGTSTLGAVTAVNNNLSVTGGILSTSTFQITGNATGTLTVASGATLTLAGTLAATTNFPTLYTNISLDPNSTVTYSSTGAQTIKATDYGILTISGARTTASITLEPGTIGIKANLTTCKSCCRAKTIG